MKYKIVLPKIEGVDKDWKRHLVIMIKADLELDIKLPRDHRVFEYDIPDGYELRVSVQEPGNKYPDSVALTSGKSNGGIYKNFEIIPADFVMDDFEEVEDVIDDVSDEYGEFDNQDEGWGTFDEDDQ